MVMFELGLIFILKIGTNFSTCVHHTWFYKILEEYSASTSESIFLSHPFSAHKVKQVNISPNSFVILFLVSQQGFIWRVVSFVLYKSKSKVATTATTLT